MGHKLFNLVDPEPLVIGRQTLEEVYGESPKERAKPPHHLLETQIFPNLHKNEIFQVEPEQLSFIMQHVSKLPTVTGTGGKWVASPESATSGDFFL